MKQADVLSLVNERLLPLYEEEKTRLDKIDRWYRWNPETPKLPRRMDPELKYLLNLSRTPWLNLVVTTVAQMLYAERIYSGTRDVADMWAPWQRNGMDEKQIPLHRAALAYGLAYTTVLPGDRGAVINALSPRESLAVYGDVVEDEYPQFLLRVIPQAKGRLLRVMDEESIYYLGDVDNKVEYIEERRHGVGVCPAIRYANQMDLEGRAPGEVEPLIPVAGRINKTDYDRMLVQHFNSWKVRWATGLEKPNSEAEAEEVKMRLRQQDILTAEEGVMFGSLDETSLEGFIAAHESDVETLAAVSQTPATALTGKLVNVSAEGLIEARASLQSKKLERATSFGGSHTRTLRLASFVEDRTEDSEDFSVKIQWADTEAQTLSAAVDALGKAATMLGVPAELLWDKIPNVDLATADSWRRYAETHPSPDAVMAAAVARQTDPAA